MDRKILESLQNQPSKKHILPFFWQHGESHEVLRQEIEAMPRCGLGEFCVESRTHEEFGHEQWWEDVGFILEEAKARGMRVWLLDDKRFPTGYANNYLADHPELRMTVVRPVYYDFVGPQADMAMLLPEMDEDESLISVVAYRRKNNENVVYGEGIDLLDQVENGLVWWDIPEGAWRVYYVIRSHRSYSPSKANYIDMLVPESCQAMIDAVYQPHYDHFSQYFGNTFVGFFSDEPSFANDGQDYNSRLGKEDMLVPWRDDLPEMIAQRCGRSEEEIRCLLPALWHEIDGKTPVLRENYMEVLTLLYRDNFSYLLGDWCREHGVLYIGHIIEDMNTHQRLGYGAGHFFRALDGQDMAGCDIVLQQIIPGHLDLDHTAPVSGNRTDPEFFNYMLAKLASSHSHIHPQMKNRAMCEVYGAFGWAEGVPMMKYITDHMLVNGINYFVPHAFTPKYPDPDCPPHFYAKGNNTQFEMFGELMGYMARMAHVLTDGVHQADVAVYYNAEAEWAGGEYMLQQKVCKFLTRRQLDFDLIPQDVLVNATAEDHCLRVNEEKYRALIVPGSTYLPDAVIDAMDRLSKAGVSVLFLDKMPGMSSDLRPLNGRLAKCTVTVFGEVEDDIRKNIWVMGQEPALRFYYIKRDGRDVIMFWNEDIFRTIDTWVRIPQGQALIYDAWRNQLYKPEQDENKLHLKLSASQAVVVYIGEYDGEVRPYDYGEYDLQNVDLQWKVSLRSAAQQDWMECPDMGLGNLARKLPDYAGTIRYESVLKVADPQSVHVLDLGRVGEIAQLWINDQYCGACVGAPYRFEVEGCLYKGENQVRIEVLNNLGYHYRDQFSNYLPLPPSGIVGPVRIG